MSHYWRQPLHPSHETIRAVDGAPLQTPPRDRTSSIALCLVFALLAVALALWGYASDGGMLP